MYLFLYSTVSNTMTFDELLLKRNISDLVFSFLEWWILISKQSIMDVSLGYCKTTSAGTVFLMQPPGEHIEKSAVCHV